MKFEDAVSHVIEYVQGHTGFSCAGIQWSVVTVANNELQGRAISAEERLTGVHPCALFIDRMKIEISATLIRSWDGPPPTEWKTADVFEHAEIAYVTCRFLYEMPNGGKSAAMRIFAFRHGMIRQVA